MIIRDQHIAPHERGQAVKGAGAERVTSVHPTQRKAIEAGHDIARHQGSELLPHGRTGQIREHTPTAFDQLG